jgi:hypothetical protein
MYTVFYIDGQYCLTCPDGNVLVTATTLADRRDLREYARKLNDARIGGR